MAEAKKNTKGAPKKKSEAPKREPVKANTKTTAPQNESNQLWSILLFALGVLTALMVLVKGTKGWLALHNLLLGVFGIAAFLIPVILIYTAVKLGTEQTKKDLSGRNVWCIAMIFLASAAFQIFVVGRIPGGTWGGHFKILYEEGAKLKSGGVASLLFAGPLLKFFGKLGARLISLVLFFVFGMLLSGRGLVDFLKLLATPFVFIGKCVNGIQNMFIGGDFVDAFEDDDNDDDREKRNFDADLEAINIANSRKSSQKPSEKKAQNKKAVEALPDGFFDLDIPLPTDHLIVHDSAAPEDDGSSIDVDIDQSPAPSPAEKLPPLKKVKAPEAVPEEVPEENEETAVTDEGLEQLISKAADKKPVNADEEIIEEEEPEEEKPVYILPPIDILTRPEIRSNRTEAMEEMREKAEVIKNTLSSFGVEVRIKDIFRGPSITRYEIQPGPGIKVSKIKGLEDDIALSLAAQGVRIEAPVPGKAAVGIEIPNTTKDTVTLREIIASPEFRDSKSKLTFAVGKDITGNIILGDIAKMPHVIIAGTTGSGKSVCTRSIIMSILYNATPDEVKLILIDPKIVEFKIFENIPHLLIPIVTDCKRAAGALCWAVNEMMRRYNIFAEAGANDLKSYNELAEVDGDLVRMPQIVVFIDELADMMLVAGKDVEDYICRLAQMGRAAGMHLVVATQRPTTDVITGLIKANIPSRIALSVKSVTDSRTIIDMGGADKLLGNGDMLYMPIGAGKPVRVQGCFSPNDDIAETVRYIKAQAEVKYDPDVVVTVDNYTPQAQGSSGGSDSGASTGGGSDEDIVEAAIKVAVDAGQLSTSMLQRKLKLGYARAARIMDELEERGVIGASEGAKPRKVLMSKMQYDEWRLRRMDE
ncbi:FtsK/SpoIIIE family DNA translocase [Ruminococcus flavefaciens]|uniref:DNA segregation ATPase FtsK/SpoIIIE, S-DNA-T family n=1 Tax=Ruminococcus flavefaciens TaxID=1265 RepID=A0A1K1MAC7_RUMFL|nr:DNA translocase FtsK [Ruminococcus flavefaciens]SFW20088.1 DNA segregation ATPase FtsK/SpoIIIE, S-DNA-T family [Ruminococcus flavefaciens]